MLFFRPPTSQANGRWNFDDSPTIQGMQFVRVTFENELAPETTIFRYASDRPEEQPLIVAALYKKVPGLSSIIVQHKSLVIYWDPQPAEKRSYFAPLIIRVLNEYYPSAQGVLLPV